MLDHYASLVGDAFDLISDEELICFRLLIQLSRQAWLLQQRVCLVNVIVSLEVDDVAEGFQVILHLLLQLVFHLVAEGERPHRLQRVIHLNQCP